MKVLNYYKCISCGKQWDRIDQAYADSECPTCGKLSQAQTYDTLTEREPAEETDDL
jgi:predicted RNA-binding Zn-ribbon protein involved in translation (DUF1610 family)